MTARFFRDLVARCDAMQREQHFTDAQMAERGGMRREQYVRARGKGRNGVGDVETMTADAFARIVGATIAVTYGSAAVSLAGPVASLDLTERAENALIAAGVFTVGDLTNRTRADLMKIHGFGLGCLQEVETALAACGLRLAGGAS